MQKKEVYLFVETKKIIDKAKYAQYISLVPATISKYGGKYLARGQKIRTYSGTWKPKRLIMVKFASMQKFKSWWNSPEYKKIKHLREKGAKVNAVVLEGI